MVTVASLFDGIGGTPLCAEMSGAVCLWSSEIEKFPQKVTEYHFPNMKQYGDITKIDGSKVEPVDIIVGGSPCQDLSVAGKRNGLKHSEFGDEETTRSGLFMEQVRIVKEMRSATNNARPRYVVWENVPGAFSSNEGEDFRVVLEEFCKIANPAVRIPRSPNGWCNSGSVLADGFSLSWRTIDAQYWGVAQRRRRIYLVIDLGGQSAPEIFFESDSLPWNFAESRGAGERVAKDIERGIGSAGFKGMQGSKAGGIGSQYEVAPTIIAGQDSHVVCLQGSMIGRADKNGPQGSGINEDISFTLNTTDRHAVCYGICSFSSNSMLSDNSHSGIYEADTSRTLDLNGGNPACNQGGIAVVEPIIFEPRSQDGVPRISENGTCPTLNTAQGGQRQPCIAYGQCGYSDYIENRVSTLMASGGVLGGVLGGGSETFVMRNKLVRRLTEKECERLQGYPDNWTNIPGASGSARYKALGNSFAIPCAHFVIGGCIERIRKDRRTVADEIQ